MAALERWEALGSGCKRSVRQQLATIRLTCGAAPATARRQLQWLHHHAATLLRPHAPLLRPGLRLSLARGAGPRCSRPAAGRLRLPARRTSTGRCPPRFAAPEQTALGQLAQAARAPGRRPQRLGLLPAGQRRRRLHQPPGADRRGAAQPGPPVLRDPRRRQHRLAAAAACATPRGAACASASCWTTSTPSARTPRCCGWPSSPTSRSACSTPLPGSRRSLFGRILGSLKDMDRIQKRMHNKMFIADNAMGITGGRNLGDAYFGAGEKSNFVDLDVLAAGPHRARHVRQLRPVLERRAGLPGAVADVGRGAGSAAQDAAGAAAPTRRGNGEPTPLRRPAARRRADRQRPARRDRDRRRQRRAPRRWTCATCRWPGRRRC